MHISDCIEQVPSSRNGDKTENDSTNMKSEGEIPFLIYKDLKLNLLNVFKKKSSH